MYQKTYTAEEMRRLKAKGAQYLTVCVYDVGEHQRGDVMSWHKSHDAAQRAARPVHYAGVYQLHDMLQDAEMKGL